MLIKLTAKPGGGFELSLALAKLLIDKGLAIEVKPEERPEPVRTRPLNETGAHNRTNSKQRHA